MAWAASGERFKFLYRLKLVLLVEGGRKDLSENLKTTEPQGANPAALSFYTAQLLLLPDSAEIGYCLLKTSVESCVPRGLSL